MPVCSRVCRRPTQWYKWLTASSSSVIRSSCCSLAFNISEDDTIPMHVDDVDYCVHCKPSGVSFLFASSAWLDPTDSVRFWLLVEASGLTDSLWYVRGDRACLLATSAASWSAMAIACSSTNRHRSSRWMDRLSALSLLSVSCKSLLLRLLTLLW